MDPRDFKKVKENTERPLSWTSVLNLSFRHMPYHKMRDESYRGGDLLYIEGRVESREFLFPGSGNVGFLGRAMGRKRGVLEIHSLDDSHRVLCWTKEFYNKWDITPLNAWTMDRLVMKCALDIAKESDKKVLAFSSKKGFDPEQYFLHTPCAKGISVEGYTLSENGSYDLSSKELVRN